MNQTDPVLDIADRSEVALDATDHTPKNIDLGSYRATVSVKRRFLDRLVYPVLMPVVSAVKKRSTPELTPLTISADRVLFGDRGSGFLFNVGVLKRFVRVRGADVLIQGCGLGQEALAWAQLGARSCIGVDLFCFRRAWDAISAQAPGTQIQFSQGDLCDGRLPAHQFDIIYSAAVWEHLADLDGVLLENRRLLRCDGVVFAAFGPLWRAYGGDHFASPEASLADGYNHLLLDRSTYLSWIDSFPSAHAWASSEDSYFEIRRHIHEGLFSCLRPGDYIEKADKLFRRLHTTVILSPEGLQFKTAYPDRWRDLLGLGHTEEDLLIKGMVLMLAPSTPASGDELPASR